MRQNPRHVPRPRSSRIRTVTLLACAALVAAVALITSALIREPSPSVVPVIELHASTPSATPSPSPSPTPAKRREPTRTPTPTPTPTPTEPGGFAPPRDDDGPDDDPFDDDSVDDDADED